MAGNQDSRKKQLKREKKTKRRKERNRKSKVVEAGQPVNLNQVLSRLKQLFEGKSPDIIRLAADGKSPEEISIETGVSAEEAESLVTEFTRLPPRIAGLLADNPSVLEKPALLKMITAMNITSA